MLDRRRNQAGPSAPARPSIWKPPRCPATPGMPPPAPRRAGTRANFLAVPGIGDVPGDYRRRCRRRRRRGGARRGLVPGMERGCAARPSPGRHGCDRWSRRARRQRRVQIQCAARRASPVPDAAAAARIEALEKSSASLRAELAAARAQSEKLAALVNEMKSAPREASPSPDLSAINERLAQIERTTRAQAPRSRRTSRTRRSKPADDMPLRRVVAARLLDVSVRQGDPYVAILAAAKSLAAGCGRVEAARRLCRLRCAQCRHPQSRVAHAGSKIIAAGVGKNHRRDRHRRSPAGGRGAAGPHRAHRCAWATIAAR